MQAVPYIGFTVFTAVVNQITSKKNEGIPWYDKWNTYYDISEEYTDIIDDILVNDISNCKINSWEPISFDKKINLIFGYILFSTSPLFRFFYNFR